MTDRIKRRFDLPTGADHDDAGRLAFWWSEDDEAGSRVELTLSPLGEGSSSIRVIGTRPLEILDLAGVPAPGTGGAQHGPVLIAA